LPLAAPYLKKRIADADIDGLFRPAALASGVAAGLPMSRTNINDAPEQNRVDGSGRDSGVDNVLWRLASE
jgi:hypothetical protein